MQPENLIAWPHAFLKTRPHVQLADLARPEMPALDPADGLLADAKASGDGFLHFASSDCRENGLVPLVNLQHPSALSADYSKRHVSLDGLDEDIGAHKKQQLLDIGRAGYCVAVKPLVVHADGPAIFLDSAEPEAGVDEIQSLPLGVRQTNADAAFSLVDFYASLAVKKAGEVAAERFVRPIFHLLTMPYRKVLVKLAVPCIRWILERVELADAAMLPERAAA